jgi:hypothetical protein
MSWIGQALIATRNGHHADSRMLFEHAVTSLSADVVSQRAMHSWVVANGYFEARS